MVRAVTCVISLSLLAPAAVGGPPNVVMIVGDDQGWKDYGFMGATHVRTPNLDKLAADGLVYPRGYVPTSLCRASLASMITGLGPGGGWEAPARAAVRSPASRPIDSGLGRSA